MYLRVYSQKYDEEISVVISAIKSMLTFQTKAKSLA